MFWNGTQPWRLALGSCKDIIVSQSTEAKKHQKTIKMYKIVNVLKMYFYIQPKNYSFYGWIKVKDLFLPFFFFSFIEFNLKSKISINVKNKVKL